MKKNRNLKKLFISLLFITLLLITSCSANKPQKTSENVSNESDTASSQIEQADKDYEKTDPGEIDKQEENSKESFDSKNAYEYSELESLLQALKKETDDE